MTKYIFFSLVSFAVLLEVIADIMFRYWGMNEKRWLLAVGMAVYMIGTLFWAYSLKYEYLSKAISVFTILNLVALVLAGVVIFKEDLSLVNKLGILLALVSVVMIEM